MNNLHAILYAKPEKMWKRDIEITIGERPGIRSITFTLQLYVILSGIFFRRYWGV